MVTKVRNFSVARRALGDETIATTEDVYGIPKAMVTTDSKIGSCVGLGLQVTIDQEEGSPRNSTLQASLQNVVDADRGIATEDARDTTDQSATARELKRRRAKEKRRKRRQAMMRRALLEEQRKEKALLATIR
jgi:hypothetical protein